MRLCERCLSCAVIILVLGLSSPVARADEGLTLEAAVGRALARHPDILAAEAEVDAARGRRAGAGLLLQENPEVSVAVGPRSRSQVDTKEDLDFEISASQSLEIAGQRGARLDASSAALAAAEARVAERRAEVAARVREAFGRVLGAEAREELAEAAVELAGQALAAAEERHRRGAASLIELNTARVEVGRSNRAKLEAVRRRATAAAELRLLLAIDPGKGLSLAGELESLSLRRDFDIGELSALAAERRPALVAARRDLESARAEERLATREAVPSPRIGARYQKEEEAEIVQGTLSIDVPLFGRNQAARRVTRARTRQAETVVAGLERQIAQEVELSASRLRAARETLDGFAGDVLKALDENVSLVNKGYEAGKIDFLQLILIRRETLEARMDYIDVLEELNSAEAELDRAVGATPIGAPQDERP